MAEVVAPEVRAAQRRMVATVRVSGVLCRDGLALWREVDCGNWKATAAEIGEDLDLLEVPHHIVPAVRFPLANARNTALRKGEEVRVVRDDLPHLVRWMPSLGTSIEQLPEDCEGWAYGFLEPRADGMAAMGFALAADWPLWSDKQARRARLMCAQCDTDLRRHDVVPYNIPDPQRPQRIRLLCGNCCNDGLDELERLASTARQPA